MRYFLLENKYKDRGVLKEFQKESWKIFTDTDTRHTLCFRQVFAYRGNTEVVKQFLLLSTGVLHSHIMRQPQQGATNVVGKSPYHDKLELQFQPPAKKCRRTVYPYVIMAMC